jgi:hypothetical protein
MYHIQNIPVGDGSTFTYSDRVPGSINRFFSGEFSTFFIVVQKRFNLYKAK